jgi:hypothetical protein
VSPVDAHPIVISLHQRDERKSLPLADSLAGFLQARGGGGLL